MSAILLKRHLEDNDECEHEGEGELLTLHSWPNSCLLCLVSRRSRLKSLREGKAYHSDVGVGTQTCTVRLATLASWS